MKVQLLCMMMLGLQLLSCSENRTDELAVQVENDEPEIIISARNRQLIKLLDAGELIKAMEFIRRDEDLNYEGLLLLQCSNASYNATKVVEEEKVILLRGEFWIRSGQTLIDGRGSDKSFAMLHKKTMRIIELGGEYERTILLAD